MNISQLSMNISQLIDKAREVINSKSLSESYLIIDQIEGNIANLEIIKARKEEELEKLIERKKKAVLKPPPSPPLSKNSFEYILLGLYTSSNRQEDLSILLNYIDQEGMDRLEKEINNLREELSNLRETIRQLPKRIYKLKESLEKLECCSTHENIGYKHGYQVGYKNNEDSMQLSAYSLLEPPDNNFSAGIYKHRNEIIRRCKQYYKDGYEGGKRRGQRDRNDIMGE